MTKYTTVTRFDDGIGPPKVGSTIKCDGRELIVKLPPKSLGGGVWMYPAGPPNGGPWLRIEEQVD